MTRPAPNPQHDPPVPFVRPGRGRRRRGPDFTIDRALAEFLHHFPRPERLPSPPGTYLARVAIDPNGVATVHARISSSERKKGNTIGGQALAAMSTAEKCGISVREILVAVNMSGGRELEDRPDLMRMLGQAQTGLITHVVARDLDRLGREDVELGRFLKALRQADAHLALSASERVVDWDDDQLLMAIEGVLAHQERIRIHKRTHGSLVDRYFSEGLGWPGAYPVGFWRNPETLEVEWDEEVWDYIEEIFEEIDRRARAGEKGGVRSVWKDLRERFPISESYLRKLIKNPMYTDGSYAVNKEGRRVGQKPAYIPADRRVSPELFERVQQHLKVRRARSSVTPVGKYVLNYVPFLHEPCMHLKVRGIQCRLRGMVDVRGGREYATPYRHSPSPGGREGLHACTGLNVPPELIEPLVMGELRRLAREPEVMHHYASLMAESNAEADQQVDRALSNRAARAAANLKKAEEAKRQHRRRFFAATRDAEPTEEQELQYETEERELDQQVHETRQALTLLEAEVARGERRAKRATVSAADPEALQREADQAARTLATIEEVLSDEVPTDPDMMRRRVCATQACLSSLVLKERDGRYAIELYGPLVPAGHQPFELGPLHDLRGKTKEWGTAPDGAEAVDGEEADANARSRSDVLTYERVHALAMSNRQSFMDELRKQPMNLFKRPRTPYSPPVTDGHRPAWRSGDLPLALTGEQAAGVYDDALRAEWTPRKIHKAFCQLVDLDPNRLWTVHDIALLAERGECLVLTGVGRVLRRVGMTATDMLDDAFRRLLLHGGAERSLIAEPYDPAAMKGLHTAWSTWRVAAALRNALRSGVLPADVSGGRYERIAEGREDLPCLARVYLFERELPAGAACDGPVPVLMARMVRRAVEEWDGLPGAGPLGSLMEA